MAATATPEKAEVKILLNNGSTATGSIKTVGIGIGGSQKVITDFASSANASENRSKAIAIATALSPIMAKSFVEIQEIITSKLMNN